MGQILVRNLDDAVVLRLKQQAEERNVSLEQHVRDLLAASVRPSRAEIVAEARRIRAMIGPVPGNSTDLIREDRDNEEPYR